MESLRRSPHRRRSIRGVGLFVALGTPFVACGGEDRGRPPAPVAPPPPDGAVGRACEGAAKYEYLSIIDFEGPPAVGKAPPNGQAPRGTALSCNPALGPDGSGGEGGSGGSSAGAGGEGAVVPVCGFNFNFEQPSQCEDDPVSVSLGRQSTNLAANNPPWVGLEVPGGRCGMPTHAYHLVARNLGVCFNPANGRRGWGSNFSIDLLGDSNRLGSEFDASAWQGVSFWARKGDGPSNDAINILVGDADTSGGDYAEPAESGWTRCSTADEPNDSVKCDPFGVAVTLTEDWTLYTIPWATLKQKGYGQEAPDGKINPARIRRFQISTSTGDWDFYVDDLAFYRDKP